MDGSRCVPFDNVQAESFYLTRAENIQTTDLVSKMAVEVALCMLRELRDPKKATSPYLSSSNGKFSWGQTTDKEYLATMGKRATNDPAESPFAILTQQMQQFGRILGILASAIGQARMNGDFNRGIGGNPTNLGFYHELSNTGRESLVQYSVSLVPRVLRETRDALDLQATSKQAKKDLIWKKNIAAQEKYGRALTYIDMFHSLAC